MHDGQYMLPGEFAAVVAFLFVPPLLLALGAQSIVFAIRGLFTRRRAGRVSVGYVATVVGSFLLGGAIHLLGPPALVSALRVRDLAVGGTLWPIMPLAFVAVAGAVVFSTLWVCGRGNAGA